MVSETLSTYWATIRRLHQSIKSRGYREVVATTATVPLSTQRNLVKRRYIEAEEQKPRFPGWRGTVAAGAIVTVSTLLINLVLLVWALTLNVNRWGVAILFEGSCAEMKKISTWLHVGINILSTLLLGASNYAMQCLLSPTREEVDKAHSEGQWLDIGAVGLMNLISICKRRRRLSTILSISSIPLHLLYNSVVYNTLSANEYWAMLAGSDFSHPGPWQLVDHDKVKFSSSVNFLQQHYHSFERLENAECIQAYRGDVSTWSNVIMIANSENLAGSSVYKVFDVTPFSSSKCAWQCCGNVGQQSKQPESCDIGVLLKHANEWNITIDRLERYGQMPSYISIDHCLALPTPSSAYCTINLSCGFLAVVIFCNLIKAICLASTLKMKFRPLTTVGDAVTSFLEYPDSHTSGSCLISARDVINGRWSPLSLEGELRSIDYLPLMWKSSHHRWRKGLSLRRWYIYNLFSMSVLLTSGIIFGISLGHTSVWTAGIGAITPNAVINSTANISLLGSVVLANTPQLLCSVFYVMYNGILTSMCQSSEYGNFASERKALRVTSPQGQQRSTRYLELPYRYSIPLLIAFAVLHWLISETIFLVRINIFNTYDDPRDTIEACGYSGLAFFLVILLAGTMMIVLGGLGFKKYKKNMPIVSTCSIAISATCHRRPEDVDAAILPLMWGVVGTRDDGIGHASFSSKDVEPLVPERLYA